MRALVREFKGITCDRCGVLVTRSSVRRERMGHIDLACPVTHIWFYKAVPSRLAALLQVGLRDLEKLIYYEEYVSLGVQGIKNVVRPSARPCSTQRPNIARITVISPTTSPCQPAASF